MTPIKVAIVTGCWGFIGNHLTKRLLTEGWYVYGIDMFTYVSSNSQLRYFEENFPNKFQFFANDITKLQWLPDANVLFNLAAESHVENSFKNSKKQKAINKPKHCRNVGIKKATNKC